MDGFDEDFSSDPLRRGWYFDFDMLGIGRKRNPGDEAPVMSLDAVPYRWVKETRSLHVAGAWPVAGGAKVAVSTHGQRQRLVHPIQPLDRRKDFQATLEFQVESLGSPSANPIILGFFNSEQPLQEQSLTLQIASPRLAEWIVAAGGKLQVHPLAVEGELVPGGSYRAVLRFDSTTGRFDAALTVLTARSGTAASLAAMPLLTLPVGDGWRCDEFGIALGADTGDGTSSGPIHQYRLTRLSLKR